MISAPVSRTLSGFIALTVAAVPTGMKAGVRISPRLIEMRLVCALPSVASMVNDKRVISRAYRGAALTGRRRWACPASISDALDQREAGHRVGRDFPLRRVAV